MIRRLAPPPGVVWTDDGVPVTSIRADHRPAARRPDGSL